MNQNDKVSASDFKDNNIEWINGSETVTASFYSQKMRNRIKNLADKYPEEVSYKSNADGSIICHFPLKYVRITRPVHRELTDEERRIATERLAKSREKKVGEENESV